MKNKILYTLAFIFILGLHLQCKKEEGFGGLGTIKGKVYAYDYNNSGVLESEGYAGDIEVYISAEGKSEILDRIRTHYDGSFEIKELRKGSYEVWVYSDCDLCPNGIEPIIQKVTIDQKKSIVELKTFEVNI